MRPKSILLAVAAGLALADASIVTLALPQLLTAFDTTIQGVAAVIVVYTVVLCVTLLPAWALAQRVGYRAIGITGFLIFAGASAVCAQADTLTVLLVGRGAQAVGGAAGLVAAFALLHSGEQPQRRLWLYAAVLSTAVGPALGGALTQAFDWRAIFIAQVPIALVGVLACALEAPVGPEPVVAQRVPVRLGPAGALACVSAALTGVLFLLILLLVAGWNIEPIAAAAVVTTLPIGALIGSRVTGGTPLLRAAAGCLLVGGGVLALAWLPDANVLWTIPPQLLAGIGMGLSLPALGGELLPEHNARDAALLLTIRHAGIALALVLIAPIAAHRLDTAIARVQLQGVAVVLDAKLQPQDKIRLAPKLLETVQTQQPRNSLKKAIAAERHTFGGDDLEAYDAMGDRADDVIVAAAGSAFLDAFLIAGGFALLGALFLVVRMRWSSALAAAVALAVAAPGVYALAHRLFAPPPVRIADPCKPRSRPHAGGIAGFVQDQALHGLDEIACKNGSSREELVLALADPAEARAYKKKYGIDPRSTGGLIDQALGLLGLN